MSSDLGCRGVWKVAFLNEEKRKEGKRINKNFGLMNQFVINSGN